MTRGKSRLSLERTVRAQHALEGALEGVVVLAKRGSLSHADLLSTWRERRDGDPLYARMPEWARSQLDATFRGVVRTLHATGAIVWVHRLDGQIVQSSEVPVGQWDRVTSRHEWAHSGEAF